MGQSLRTIDMNVGMLLPPMLQVLLVPLMLVAASSDDVLTWTAPEELCHHDPFLQAACSPPYSKEKHAIVGMAPSWP